MGKSYKAKRRKIYYNFDVTKKPKETMQETLDRIGYRSEEEYRDCVSYLAW